MLHEYRRNVWLRLAVWTVVVGVVTIATGGWMAPIVLIGAVTPKIPRR